MSRDDIKWWAVTIFLVLLAAAVPAVALQVFGGFDSLGAPSDKRLAAVLSFVGVTLTLAGSLIATQVKRESERRLERQHDDEDARLRLDAAMRAGGLFNASDGAPADPAAVASGLLALPQLGRADLAVVLLVDLWDRERLAPHAGAPHPQPETEPAATRSNTEASATKRDPLPEAEPQAAKGDPQPETEFPATDLGPQSEIDSPTARSGGTTEATEPGSQARAISHETAILVIDAALRSGTPNAELVAAELLCRNANRLDVCQSLHWPSSVDGRWNPSYGAKTKVLIVEALVRMACSSAPSLNALQSLAVRLYGISRGDQDPHVKGCLGMLLQAILPALKQFQVRSLMQGPAEITLTDIETASKSARPNEDLVLFRIVQQRSAQLNVWAARCSDPDFAPGSLSTA